MPGFVLCRGLVSGGSKAGISSATAAAPSNQETLPGRGEVVQLFAGLGIVDYRAHRCQDIDRFALVPRAITSLAVAASFGFVLGIEAEMQQSILVRAGDQVNVSTAAAIATAGTAARNKLLAAKSQTAITTVACFYVDPDFVDEHGINKLELVPPTRRRT